MYITGSLVMNKSNLCLQKAHNQMEETEEDNLVLSVSKAAIETYTVAHTRAFSHKSPLPPFP